MVYCADVCPSSPTLPRNKTLDCIIMVENLFIAIILLTVWIKGAISNARSVSHDMWY